MLALHGEVAPGWLLEPALRESLAHVGATGLQINVDDAPVSAAIRFGHDESVIAVGSVWTDGGLRDAINVVADIAGESGFDAYRVSERVRLDPQPTPDGVRSDVVAQMALLRRPEGMSREAYLEYWLRTHTPIAIRTQNTSAYIQNIVEETLTPGSPELSAIVEEHFPMAAMTDRHEYFGSRGDEAELQRRMGDLLDSVAKFGADRDLDLVPTSRYFWSLA
jgi:hypothetical protein